MPGSSSVALSDNSAHPRADTSSLEARNSEAAKAEGAGLKGKHSKLAISRRWPDTEIENCLDMGTWLIV